MALVSFLPQRLCMLVLLALLLAGTLLPGHFLAQAAPPQQASTPVGLPPELFGLVARDPYYEVDPKTFTANKPAQDEMGRRMAELGVRWVRLEFIADDNGRVNFDKYDYFIGTVAPRHDLKVLGLLATPILRGDPVYWQFHLMNTEPVTDTARPEYGAGLNTYMRRWLEDALRVAERYDGSNTRAGRVHAWELFNEANRLLGDGTGLPAGLSYAGLNPVRLGRLHAKFYRICKNTDGSQQRKRCPDDTKIILGGLHPKGTSARRMGDEPETFEYTDREYLEAMYGPGGFSDFRNADPLRRWPVDGIGYHPYPEEINLVERQDIGFDLFKIESRMTKLRETLAKLGDGQNKFWITEIGYNVGFFKNRGPSAAADQAEFMRQVFTRLWARGDVANVFWFKYEDFPPANVVFNDDGVPVADPQRWGLVRIPFRENPSCSGGACYDLSGKPNLVRPAYFVYRELAGLPVEKTYLAAIAR
jgi:hypothetical protein